MRLTRFQVFLTFATLILLRLTIGYHFFKEGVDKIQNGFTAEYFLSAAKGHLAPAFHSLIEDRSGELIFSLVTDDESGEKQISPELTLALWDDFLDRANVYYGFNGQQKLGGEAILKDHTTELVDWYAIHEVELLAFFQTVDRVSGFERDGEASEKVALYVDSLRDQVTSIKSDRNKQSAAWSSEIKAIWDSYERQINGLVEPETTSIKVTPEIKLHRPFEQKYSKLQLIDNFIPWFDLIIGGLLMVGLFTRVASFCGAAFLLSVIATQPPWVPGTAPIDYQAVELVALLVLFATAAGRLGGLDFFFARTPGRATENS